MAPLQRVTVAQGATDSWRAQTPFRAGRPRKTAWEFLKIYLLFGRRQERGRQRNGLGPLQRVTVALCDQRQLEGPDTIFDMETSGSSVTKFFNGVGEEKGKQKGWCDSEGS